MLSLSRDYRGLIMGLVIGTALFLSGAACSSSESVFDAGKRSALDKLEKLGEHGFVFLKDHRDREAGVWLLEFERGQERVLVEVSEEDGSARGVDFSTARREAFSKPLDGDPALTNEAAQQRALAIARRFAPEADLRPDPIAAGTAKRSSNTRYSRICRIKLRMFVDGYEVEGKGCVVEFDHQTSRLISYAGGYDVSRRNATPAKPLTLQEAVDCLSISLKRKTALPLPDESRLAFMNVNGRPYTLTWFLKFSRLKVSYHVDAGTGEVLGRVLHK